MKKLFSSLLSWRCLAALFAVLMVSTPFAINNYLVDKGPSWLGLDVSWKMTLDYAFAKHWVWGKDIVYTYGPLANLSTRTGLGFPAWAMVVFDVFLVLNFYFVFADFIKNNASKPLAIAIVICLALLVNPCFGSDTAWILLFFIIYWMIKTFDKPRPLYLAILITLTILAFYIKMNTGLIAMVLLCSHFINLFTAKKLTIINMSGWFAWFIVLIMLSAILLNVSILGYITGSLEIIKGYNDVMYLDESHAVIETALYLLFLAMLALLLYSLWRQVAAKKHNQIMYTIAGIVFLFLLQKQAVLRNDAQHLYEYFSFAPLLLLCNFTAGNHQKSTLKYSLIILIFALGFVLYNRGLAYSLSSRITAPFTYIKQVVDHNKAAHLSQPGKRYIPQRVLDIIGNKTADVFPWDSEYVIENKLNYKPRPVFQSFSAYTEGLEKINYDYFVKQAPNFLIYDYDAIDNRYPFNDESLANLFILRNYTLADTFASNQRQRLVLQRNDKTAPLQFKHIKRFEFSPADTIPVTNFNFIKLDVQYNLPGKIKAFVNKPPRVQISYMRADGKWFTYKTSPELLKMGLYVGCLVTNDDEYIALLNDKPAAAIKKIKLIVNGSLFSGKGLMDIYLVNHHSLLNKPAPDEHNY
ncbi:hypothetical protein [Mucilaginibacter flavidus]|uniref:hypothetical protein n=1 Tax=Mucilaginibacter flavidus TaxID=2949309 RepID=UPI002092FA5E|nr:hypothetical protein [Mucilaginibacter flavidus]MCO5950815.1 hypothetical protein [Mucilaginibacter flavidus]